ncbi:MAG: hypothetical protein IJ828_00175 [Treponema sp.]|nr:hypothetical protein [Treponema sp.]
MSHFDLACTLRASGVYRVHTRCAIAVRTFAASSDAKTQAIPVHESTLGLQNHFSDFFAGNDKIGTPSAICKVYGRTDCWPEKKDCGTAE